LAAIPFGHHVQNLVEMVASDRDDLHKVRVHPSMMHHRQSGLASAERSVLQDGYAPSLPICARRVGRARAPLG
jgi:hypothetical protein